MDVLSSSAPVPPDLGPVAEKKAAKVSYCGVEEAESCDGGRHHGVGGPIAVRHINGDICVELFLLTLRLVLKPSQDGCSLHQAQLVAQDSMALYDCVKNQ